MSQPHSHLSTVQSIQAKYQPFRPYFPQIKPEKIAIELSDDEKVVLSILKANSPVDLNRLKEQTGLSNKKWDKAIKGLIKKNLAKVEKTDAGLFVSLV